ncbi:MAG: peptide-methionine (R)-S-oxide reductase [Pseudomonadota bacterium]
MTVRLSRRAILRAGVGAAAVAPLALPSNAQKYVPGEDSFAYEVQRSEADWLADLGENDYKILRLGHTEMRRSSEHWNREADVAGLYSCKGCDLPLYQASWKRVLDIGWVFFNHSEPNAVLTAIEWPDGAGMMEEFKSRTAIEAHCRRCGSHLGHIVSIKNEVLHCINGASLTFAPAST